MAAMKKQTLGERIRLARKTAGLTQAELGAIFSISREAVSLWENDTNAPTADKLGRIAAETHVSSDWLITGRGEMEGPQPSMASLPIDGLPLRPGTIPVLGMGAGGNDGEYEWNGEEIDRVDCPPMLDGVTEAYAIYVSGHSMSPRYNDGELLFVNPSKSIHPGCFVVVQFHKDEGGGSPKVWVKQFVGRAPQQSTFRQYNPPAERKIPTQRIIAVHRIVGTGER